MSIPFPNPDPHEPVVVATELAAIKAHFKHRKVPRTSTKHLLLATWNVANRR